MKVIFHEKQKNHFPSTFLSSGRAQPNPEQPERVDALMNGALAAGLTAETPLNHGLSAITRVHSPEYIHFLKNIYERWKRIPDSSEEVIPNIHPPHRNASYPKSAVGQVGFHVMDTSCPITAETFDSVCWSAQSAIHGANLVRQGAKRVYSLCRPPGHHAARDLVGGFCYLNNTAIAARYLLDHGIRPAIVDVDLHHGNGTQSIFYSSSEVLTVSVHADPIRYYPFYWGHAEERGEGEGMGYNLNLPLPRGSGDDAFLNSLDQGIERINYFSPQVLVVALGLDAFEGDPFGGLSISTQGFEKIGQACAGLNLPMLLVQEGGYLCPELGDNLTAFINGCGTTGS